MITVKHSTNPGAVPNLTPGEIGHNVADDALFVRAAGKRVRIDLQAVRDRAISAIGSEGAPLVKRTVGASWEDDMAASSLIGGKVKIDLPPAAGQYGVPGVTLTGLSPDKALSTGGVIVEPFYVRSDAVTLTTLALVIRSAAPAPVRIGIATAEGAILYDYKTAPSAQGLNLVDVQPRLILPRGAYQAVFWTGAAITLGVAKGVQPDQGWTTSGSNLAFPRSFSGSGAYTNGLAIPSLNPDLSATPGVDKTIRMAWSLP